jgi:hypothetical protein
MSEPTLKEAWAEYEFCQCGIAACLEEMDLARALALASHAAGCRLASRDTGLFCGRGWSCEIRAQIERLGR